jgi:predicted Zn-dependent protease
MRPRTFSWARYFFSKGIVDPALEEWKLAESLNPMIPSLQASMGRVLLEVKKQPAEAAAEFQRGLQMEPSNAALYLGLNQAMQQMEKPQPSAQR